MVLDGTHLSANSDCDGCFGGHRSAGLSVGSARPPGPMHDEVSEGFWSTPFAFGKLSCFRKKKKVILPV